MGTKNNPGAFDCYANAEPDEPMFVLLGRDRHAAALVNLWAAMRTVGGDDAAKINEASQCANDMMWWLAAVKPLVDPAGLRTLAQGLVLMAAQCGQDLTIASTATGATITFTPREAGES